MRIFCLNIFLVLPFLIFSSLLPLPLQKLIKKAEKNIEKGNIKQAKYFYSKALEKNPDSYEAQLGMGLLLCELLENYHDALPHLEAALGKSPRDTLSDLTYALAKCYQY